jgi:hypothetical protein
MLLYCPSPNPKKLVGTIIEADTVHWSRDDFTRIRKAFVKEHGDTMVGDDCAEFITLWPGDQIDGVYYDWWLAGPNGADYRVILLPGDTREKERAVKRALRNSFDVVHMSTLKIHNRVDFDPLPYVQSQQ